jgi:hypothetical protein
MTDRFLLYIDLLGFTEIVRAKNQILPDLFQALDKSSAHGHGVFRVIQFSDTLLIYNAVEPTTSHDKNYVVMYLCEFAQEIQYKLLGRDTFFRGVITFGQFEDTEQTPNTTYQNIRAFWGVSLVKAYLAASQIQAIGLFVDETAISHMNIFETHLFDREAGLWFADTATTLRNKFFDGVDFSYAQEDIVSSGNESLVAYDLVYLRRLYEHSHDLNLAPRVRNKYLNTWEIYRRKYRGLCSALEENAFDFDKIMPIGWQQFTDKVGTPEGYFG